MGRPRAYIIWPYSQARAQPTKDSLGSQVEIPDHPRDISQVVCVGMYVMGRPRGYIIGI